MKIGINLLYLRPEKVGGSEVYIRSLIPELSRQSEITLFLFSDFVDSFSDIPDVRIVPVAKGNYSNSKRLIMENSLLGLLACRFGVQVLFSPANIGAPFLPFPIPQVVTIHDLQHLKLPHYFDPRRRLIRHFLMNASLRRCVAAICISEYTRDDLVRNFYVSEEKRIKVVHEGVDFAKQPPERRCREVAFKYGLKNDFVYYPAALAPHKNHEMAIRAVKMVIERENRDIDLVLTGEPTDRIISFKRHVGAAGMADRVHHLGFVPREDVLSLLVLAKALVFPSRFEGFGLPILEAMQFGTPVLASDVTSIPEIAGRGAWLVNPDDSEGWCAALISVLRGGPMVEEKVRLGYENVTKFSWRKCGDETLSVFEDILVKSRKAA
jgi:glycosyltransferase involved in cell wall biosynthesis